LWYDFRWAGSEEFDGRMLRLFETGNIEEARIIRNLREIGCEVHEFLPGTNVQIGVVALGGHFRGHLDGTVLGLPEAPKTWHVLEAKTHNEKSFKQLESKGVQVSKPEHFAQMQVYMHLTALTRAVYVAVNKNTSEVYVERVHYDFNVASRIIASAKSIIEAKSPPVKIGGPSSFDCKFCHHHARCHRPTEGPAVPVNVNCRTCCHATPIIEDGNDGPWKCEKFGKVLSEQEQAAACDHHIYIPDFITFAKPIDGTDGEVVYRNDDDNQEWMNGISSNAYSSAELATLNVGTVGDPAISAVKLTMGGKVIQDCPF
jgi:hypothetical protein